MLSTVARTGHRHAPSTKTVPRQPERTVRDTRARVNYDPEGILGSPSVNLIEKHLVKKQIQQNQQLAAQVKHVRDESVKIAMVRRESRTVPAKPEDLVEYLLSMETEDMEFEVTRCRPLLNDAFYKYLDKTIGEERFAAQPDQDRLAELEMLRQYLQEVTVAVDQVLTQATSAVDRMKKLLSSRDKKATILEMAETNEIDHALMDLLQQNINAARQAEQEDAALFMEKVLIAASKYLISAAPAATTVPAPPAPKASALLTTDAPASTPSTTAPVAPATATAPASSSSVLLTPGQQTPAPPKGSSGLVMPGQQQPPTSTKSLIL